VVVLRDEYVLRFDIPVHVVVLVEIVDRFADVPEIALD